MTQPDLFAGAEPVQGWRPAPGRGKCARDLAAGPGSCWFWWDGCPRPEQRECYSHWARANPDAARKQQEKIRGL